MSLIKIDATKAAERKATSVRAERDNLLTVSDWTQIIDVPVDQVAWAEYRQALRDVPQQAGFPNDVTWPEAPAGKREE